MFGENDFDCTESRPRGGAMVPGRAGILPAPASVSLAGTNVGRIQCENICRVSRSAGRDARQGRRDAHPTRGRCTAARCVLAVALLFLLALAPLAHARDFDLVRDTFAFSNDTVMKYGVDEAGQLHITKRDKPVEFGHRCFVLARGVLQFYKFAQFEPRQPKLSREEYKARMLRLFRIPVWASEQHEKVVFPGFADLHAFSIAYEGLLKENLGNWIPSYLRIGNWRMMMGHPRAGQERLEHWLVESMERGEPRALFLTRFPHMNHVVIVYRMEKRPDGRTRFLCYDPNYPGVPSWVEYIPEQRSFEFQKRWYFPGGRINVLRVFISPFH